MCVCVCFVLMPRYENIAQHANENTENGYNEWISMNSLYSLFRCVCGALCYCRSMCIWNMVTQSHKSMRKIFQWEAYEFDARIYSSKEFSINFFVVVQTLFDQSAKNDANFFLFLRFLKKKKTENRRIDEMLRCWRTNEHSSIRQQEQCAVSILFEYIIWIFLMATVSTANYFIALLTRTIHNPYSHRSRKKMFRFVSFRRRYGRSSLCCQSVCRCFFFFFR